jgi:hypothetical protein
VCGGEGRKRKEGRKERKDRRKTSATKIDIYIVLKICQIPF